VSEEFSVIGKRLPRADALEKVKGEAKYTSDLQLPGMLYAKFARSPYAHSRITKIDTTKAEAFTGVKCVLTHKNVPKVHPIPQIPGGKFEYLLDETVHRAGEEVAALAAVAPEIAEEALKLIDIEYEMLPAVFDKEEAMKPDAPLVYPELGSNLYRCPRTTPEGVLTLDWGDVEKGFAEADYIIEGTYESPMQKHVSPEPRSVVCQWIGDKLTCWASTQVPQVVREDLSCSLGIPLSHVRVISTYSVGGYGLKTPEKTATLTAILAKRTGRPVKTLFTRAEDFVGTHRRIDSKIYARLGVKRDGMIKALYVKMITNFGANSQVAYFIPAAAAANTCSILYEYQNSRFEGYHVITNNQDHGGFNGFGDTESGFCIERLIDEAAEKIGMDPVEFRLKNCVKCGDKGIELENVVFGPVEWGVIGPDVDSLQECIRKVAEKAKWKKKWKGWGTPVEVRGAKKRGIGVAIGMHFCVAEAPDSSTVKMNRDGSADVLSSDPDIGQGLRTAMAQVVAEVLGIQYEDVNVVLADTTVTPYGAGIFASRGIGMGANAAYLAAQDARQKLFEIAAPRLGVKPKDLEAKERRVYIKAQKEKGIPIAELCLIGQQITGNAILPYPWYDKRTSKRITPVSVAATIAEVEVDTETGELEVLRLVSAHDCGRAINPQLVENQIDVSVVLGNGLIRSEEYIIDKKLGVMLNSNLLDYKIMTILDMPKREDLQEIFVEFPTTWGPFGAKGMAETATTTQAPAIANAVYNATGIRIRGDHLTPDRILEALRKGNLGGE
jgi:CO/xanthine dehydrogenase Mo-binding subunit